MMVHTFFLPIFTAAKDEKYFTYQSNVTSPMSKTSDFPIDVWECQNVLDMIQKVKFSSELLVIFDQVQNILAFPK